jgi:exonuclease VII large subunit
MKPSQYIAILMAGIFLILTVACENQPDSETNNGVEVTSQDVQKETREAIDAAAQYLEQEKAVIQQKIEANIEAYNQKLSELRVQANAMSADTQAKVNEKIDALEEKKEKLSDKAEELKTTSAEAMKEMQAGIQKAMEDLEASYQEALAQFE